ncbi:MAG: hypothetical protein AAF437_02395 [Pseudomonadota bacterium]
MTSAVRAGVKDSERAQRLNKGVNAKPGPRSGTGYASPAGLKTPGLVASPIVESHARTV